LKGHHTLRPRCSWEDNIRTDLREMRREVVDWMCLAKGRDQWQGLGNTVMNLQVTYKAGIS